MRVFTYKKINLTALFIALLFISISHNVSAAPILDGCEIFPDNSIFNTPIDGLPVHPLSDTYIANTGGAGRSLHPDFGSGVWPPGSDFIIGIPFITVDSNQPDIDVVWTAYGDESDDGPYPIPLDAPNEGGPSSSGDRHVIAVDTSSCTLYELYSAYPNINENHWEADSGAVWDLSSNAMRPDGWTSSDAAGLPVMPLLIQYDEVVAGVINHALRFTVSCTQSGVYTWPASHHAGYCGAGSPPFGTRFRLKADFPVQNFSPNIQVILRAFQTYGLILADNGSDWFISGEANEGWDNTELRELRNLTAGDFEAVDQSGLFVQANSYQAQTPPDRTDNLETVGSLSEYPVTPTLQWNHDPSYTWYNVVMWHDDNNSVPLNQWYEVGNTITCTATCSIDPTYAQTLLNGVYNWYVQPYDPIHGAAPFSLRSETNEFEVTIPAPEQPTSLAIVGDLTTPPIEPSYQWDSDEGTQWYNLIVNRNGAQIYNGWFEASLICNTACEAVPDITYQNGDYTWTVQPYSEVLAQMGTISATANFSINIGAFNPTNFVVNGSLTAPPIAPTIVWNHDGITEYYNIWVGGVNGTSGTILSGWYHRDDLNCGGTCALNTPPNGINYTNGTYQVWMQGWNSVTGTSDWVSSNVFVVNVPAPSFSNMVTVGSLTSQPVSPQFQWDHDGISEWFNIWIGNDDRTLVSGWYPSTDFNCTNTCILALPAGVTLADGDYQWWMQAWGFDQTSAWQSIDFTVDALNGTVNGSLTAARVEPSLTWAYDGVSEYYNIYVGGPNQIVNQWFQVGVDITCTTTCNLDTPLTGETAYINGDYQWWMQSYSAINGTSGWTNPNNFTVNIVTP